MSLFTLPFVKILAMREAARQRAEMQQCGSRLCRISRTVSSWQNRYLPPVPGPPTTLRNIMREFSRWVPWSFPSSFVSFWFWFLLEISMDERIANQWPLTDDLAVMVRAEIDWKYVEGDFCADDPRLYMLVLVIIPFRRLGMNWSWCYSGNNRFCSWTRSLLIRKLPEKSSTFVPTQLPRCPLRFLWELNWAIRSSDCVTLPNVDRHRVITNLQGTSINKCCLFRHKANTRSHFPPSSGGR